MNALIALALLQDPLSKVVPLDIPVGLLRPTVARLAQASGVKLSVSDAVWDTEVFVASKDLTLKEIMDAVGRINFAIWERTKDGYVLVPDRNLREKIKQEQKQAFKIELLGFFQENRGKWFADPLTEQEVKVEAERQEEASKRGAWRPSKLQEQSPAIKLIGRVLLKLPLDVLSSCPAGGRVVLSSHPTSMQFALPRLDLGPDLVPLTDEFKRWSKNGLYAEGSRTYSYDANGGPRLWDTSGNPVTHVVVDRSASNSNGTTIRLRQFRAQGSVAAEYEIQIKSKSAPDYSEYAPEGSASDTYPITPEASEVGLVLSQGYGQSSTPKLAQSKIEPFLNMATLDFISVGTTPFYRTWAHKLGGNVAMVVPDLALNAARWKDLKKQPADAKAQMAPVQYSIGWALQSRKPATFGRVQVMTTPAPEKLLLACVDRRPIQRLFDQVRANPKDAQDAILAYQIGATTQNYDFAVQVAAAYARVPVRHLMFMNPLAKVYWSLPKAQRALLEQGKDVVLNKASGRPFQLLEQALYVGDGNITYVGAGVPLMETGISEYAMSYLHNLAQEPSTSFPIAPSRYLLRGAKDVQEVVYRVPDAETPAGTAQPESFDQAARSTYFEKQPGYYPPGYPTRDYYHVGRLTRLQLMVPLSEGLSLRGQLFLNTAYEQPKPVLKKDLPKEWLKKLAEAEAKVAKEYANMQGGQEVAPPAKP